MNQVYGKYGISVQDALFTVTFYRNGTWTSKDTAKLIAVAGTKKGVSVNYHTQSRGTFTFKGVKGSILQTYSKHTVNGRPIELKSPESISMKLQQNNSVLEIVEDYGAKGCLRYCLKRN
jgi:hypothetical protein